MNQRNSRRRTSIFYLLMGLIGLLAILIGFSKTFIIPVSRQTFKAPVSIYIHAALSFAWVFLFTLQAFFIQVRKHKLHMKLGMLGIVVAILTTVTLLPVAKYIVDRDLRAGLGQMAYSGSVGLYTTGIIFLALVGIGLLNRGKPQLHKRLLLLATIVLLWPAWFRFRHFFPAVPRPDIWFGVVLADSLIVIAWIWDRVQNKRIHPALLYVGLAIMIEQTIEVLMFDSKAWREIGRTMYQLL